MTRTIRRAALSAALSAAALSAPLCSTGHAATPEEERVLGSDCEDAQLKSYLPFTRSIGTSGVIKGSLAESAAAAGVPPAAMLEALNAFATAIDLERDLKDGDRFYVRYERAFTIEGNPMGVGRVLWVELKTQAKGTLAIHRFRATKTDAEAFWFANGQGTQAAINPDAAQEHFRVVGLRPARRSVRPAVGAHRADGAGGGPWTECSGTSDAGAFPSANWKPKTTQVQPQVQPKPQAAAQTPGQNQGQAEEPAGQSHDQPQPARGTR